MSICNPRKNTIQNKDNAKSRNPQNVFMLAQTSRFQGAGLSLPKHMQPGTTIKIMSSLKDAYKIFRASFLYESLKIHKNFIGVLE